MLGIISLVDKCNRLHEYNLQLENKVMPLQSQVAKLQKELRGSFKSTTTLKKKNDDLNVALSVVHRKLRQESSLRISEVKKFKSVIGRLEEEFACAPRELEVSKEIAMATYKESKAYKADLVDGNIEATEIGFNCLYNMLAIDHLTMDLS